MQSASCKKSHGINAVCGQRTSPCFMSTPKEIWDRTASKSSQMDIAVACWHVLIKKWSFEKPSSSEGTEDGFDGHTSSFLSSNLEAGKEDVNLKRFWHHFR